MAARGIVVVRRKWAVSSVVALGLVLLSIAVFIAGATVGNGVIACDSCHAMRPFVEAQRDSGHAEVACARCHVDSGALGAVAAAPRGLGWVLAASWGATSSANAVGDSGCRSCHAEVLRRTITASGIRVRHADFSELRCTKCHSGTGHTLPGAWYLRPQMADCTQCHRTSAGNSDSCTTCHVDDPNSARAAGESAWRVTHGATWARTHGMGDLDSCAACHSPAYCARCHEVDMPHPGDWPKRHGKMATSGDDACQGCHESEWCTSCHGVPMPHPADFLPRHGQAASEATEAACAKCHSMSACDACHYRSAHPDVPGVDAGSHGGARR